MRVEQLVPLVLTFFWTARGTYEAPLVSGSHPEVVVPNVYIVKLRQDCTLATHFRRIEVSRDDLYFKNVTNLEDFKAYIGYFPSAEVAKIRSDTCVRQIAHDLRVGNDSNLGVKYSDVPQHRKTANGFSKRQSRRDWEDEHQEPATWNLVMLSQMQQNYLEPFNEDSLNNWGRYDYENHSGIGVDIYTLEASFDLHDREINGRASILGIHDQDQNYLRYTLFDPITTPFSHGGLTAYEDSVRALCVACIAAGRSEGVAKNAHIVNIPIEQDLGYASMTLDELVHTDLTVSRIITAFKDVERAHLINMETRPANFHGSVLLLSGFFWTERYASEISEVLIDVAKWADHIGILVVAGAGNEGHQLDGSPPYSLPCQLPGVVCVGSVDRSYRRWVSGEREGKSSYGPAISLWAPGYDIPCSNLHGGYQIANGTSFAAAHVAGAAAIFMGYKGKNEVGVLYNTLPVREYLFNNGKRDWMNVNDLQWGNIDFRQPHIGRNLLLNTGINSLSTKPFAEESVFGGLEELVRADSVDLSSTDEPTPRTAPRLLPPRSAPECAPIPRLELGSVDWDAAQALYLRMLYERAHINIYNPNPHYFDDPLYSHLDQVVPCHEDACVTLQRTRGPYQTMIIPNSRLLERYVFHIIETCSYHTRFGRTTGGTMQLEEAGYEAFNISVQQIFEPDDYSDESEYDEPHSGDAESDEGDYYDEDEEEERNARNSGHIAGGGKKNCIHFA